MTRTAKATWKTSKTTAWARRRVGRPVGFLDAWLSVAGAFETKAGHTQFDVQATLDRATRSAGRMAAKADPDGADLLAEERPKEDGEASEAESVG